MRHWNFIWVGNAETGTILLILLACLASLTEWLRIDWYLWLIAYAHMLIHQIYMILCCISLSLPASRITLTQVHTSCLPLRHLLKCSCFGCMLFLSHIEVPLWDTLVWLILLDCILGCNTCCTKWVNVDVLVSTTEEASDSYQWACIEWFRDQWLCICKVPSRVLPEVILWPSPPVFHWV